MPWISRLYSGPASSVSFSGFWAGIIRLWEWLGGCSLQQPRLSFRVEAVSLSLIFMASQQLGPREARWKGWHVGEEEGILWWWYRGSKFSSWCVRWCWWYWGFRQVKREKPMVERRSGNPTASPFLYIPSHASTQREAALDIVCWETQAADNGRVWFRAQWTAAHIGNCWISLKSAVSSNYGRQIVLSWIQSFSEKWNFTWITIESQSIIASCVDLRQTPELWSQDIERSTNEMMAKYTTLMHSADQSYGPEIYEQRWRSYFTNLCRAPKRQHLSWQANHATGWQWVLFPFRHASNAIGWHSLLLQLLVDDTQSGYSTLFSVIITFHRPRFKFLKRCEMFVEILSC